MTVQDLLKKARGKLNQADFAKRLGKSQPMISKYEKGEASPPIEVINACLEILGGNIAPKDNISSKDLAKRVQHELADAQFLHTRRAIEAVLNDVMYNGRAEKEA